MKNNRISQFLDDMFKLVKKKTMYYETKYKTHNIPKII